MQQFQGRVALVTGGAGGIGAAVSSTLARLGAEVTATCVDARERDARRDDPELIDVTLEVLDVGEEKAVRAFAAARSQLDLLVNCAGITLRGPEAFEEDAFLKVVDINLNGTMRTCRAFLPQLTQARGAIVNIASMMSLFGSGTAPGYAASKGGVSQLTKSLAIAWADQGVRVNAVAPGWIETPMTKAAIDPALRARVEQRTPQKRWGQPQDIANAVVFLCSPEAAFITGVILPVDGGYSVA